MKNFRREKLENMVYLVTMAGKTTKASKKVKTTILNYRVIVEKEHYDDGTPVYSATCPTLGVFDYGDSIDAVLKSIKDGIESMIDFLTEQGEEIPVDHISESVVTFTSVKVSPKSARLVGI